MFLTQQSEVTPAFDMSTGPGAVGTGAGILLVTLLFMMALTKKWLWSDAKEEKWEARKEGSSRKLIIFRDALLVVCGLAAFLYLVKAGSATSGIADILSSLIETFSGFLTGLLGIGIAVIALVATYLVIVADFTSRDDVPTGKRVKCYWKAVIPVWAGMGLAILYTAAGGWWEQFPGLAEYFLNEAVGKVANEETFQTETFQGLGKL
jgi:hypothetical protein